eukprot:Em0023g17a
MLGVFPLRGIDLVKAAVKLSSIEEVPEHSFIVVEQLISQVIVGVDFLQQQSLVLEFTTLPVSVTVARQKRPTPVSTAPGPAPLPEPEALQAIRKGERERREKVCIVASPEDPASDEADKCVIPIFNEFADADLSSLALKRQCDRQETNLSRPLG